MLLNNNTYNIEIHIKTDAEKASQTYKKKEKQRRSPV
jgi:hypothetical protein